MNPFLVVLVLVAASALCLFGWRYLVMVENIKVAREKAGDSAQRQLVVDLDERVKKIERYMEGG